MYSLNSFVELCVEEGVVSTMCFFLYLDVIYRIKVFGLCFWSIPRYNPPLPFSQTELLHTVALASLCNEKEIALRLLFCLLWKLRKQNPEKSLDSLQITILLS